MSHSTQHERFRAILRKLVLLAFAFLLAMMLSQLTRHTIALAQQPDLAVDIIPSSLDLPPQGQIQVQVMISNLSNTTLQTIQLTTSSNTNIKVTNTLPVVNTLPPGGQYIWQIQFSRAGLGPLSGLVQLRIDYKRQVQGQPGSVRRVIFSSFMANNLQPTAEIQVITSLTSLSQQQPGVIYLLITNKSDFTLVVKNVMTNGPDFIHLSPELSKDGVTIPSSQTRTIVVNVTVPGVVEPGNSLLIFEIGYQWYDAGKWQQGSMVANQQINADILGESQLLSLLGIPSLLVLPGFLALATIRLMRGLRSKPPPDVPPLLDQTKPEFWVIAITLSGITAFVYPQITKWITGMSRSYLVRYELSDVVYIWLASIGLAIIAYVLFASFHSLYIRQHILYTQQRTPVTEDEPATILHKLARQKLSAYLKYVYLKVPEETPQTSLKAYLIEPYQNIEGKEEYWVSPGIKVQGEDPDNPDYDEQKGKSILNLQKSLKARLDLIDEVKENTVPSSAHIKDYLQSQNIPETQIHLFRPSTTFFLQGLHYLHQSGTKWQHEPGKTLANLLTKHLASYLARRLSIRLLSELADLLAQGDKLAWNVEWDWDQWELQKLQHELFKLKRTEIDFDPTLPSERIVHEDW